MRFLVFIVFSAALLGCTKKNMLRKLEGRWQMTKTLKEDGTYVSKSDIYEFTSGKPDEWLPLVIYGSDTTNLLYKPSKIQHKVEVIDPNNVIMEDIWGVEDIDKNSMVMRNLQGVHYFDKID